MKKRFVAFAAIGIVSVLAFALLAHASFSDIIGHKYQAAIDFIQSKNIVSGYPDGTYRPDAPINRAELLTIIIGQKYKDLGEANCFTDVTGGNWYTKFVCKGKELGFAAGYPDGTFRPADNVNFVEALIMLQRAHNISVNVSTSPWYTNSVDTASAMNIIPLDIYDFNQKITRGQMAEMMTRILKQEDGTLADYLGTKKDFQVTFNDLQTNTAVEYQWQACQSGQTNYCHSSVVTQSPACSQDKTFSMIVLFDDVSYPNVSDDNIHDYFDLASKFLYDRTCTHIVLNGIWHVNFSYDGDNSDIDELSNINLKLHQILSENPLVASKTNGFTVFSKSISCSRENGGCAMPLNLTETMNPYGVVIPDNQQMKNFCNSFAALDGSTNALYGMVDDWNHKFGACGYDDNGNHVSDTSINGECRNTQGTQCVMHNGYYMCQNLLNDYYATDPRIFSIGTIIHEIMHHYGTNGNMDHYGTSTCATYPAPKRTFLCDSSDEAECYFVMCPYTYENFKNAKNLCN